MARRSELESFVCRILSESGGGWTRDIGGVTGAILDYNARFPNLRFVQDGRKETGFTEHGRGTSLYDLVRLNGVTMMHDWLSVKTATIGADGKLPSRLYLTVGTADHVEKVLSGIQGKGASFPTLVVAAEKGTGVPRILTLDLSTWLRDYPPAPKEYYPPTGWGRGKAPVSWLQPSERESGGTTIEYDALCVSLASMGISREDWKSVPWGELPAYVETAFDWDNLSKLAPVNPPTDDDDIIGRILGD